MLLLLSLLACGPTPEEQAAAARVAFRATLTDPAAATCFDAACVTAPDAASCFQAACPAPKAVWRIVPERVGWDPQTFDFFVQTHVSYEPGGWGAEGAVRKDPVYVGVTLVTAEGEEIDLAVQTRFPTELEEPFFLATNVGKPVRDVIVGLWDRKIEPCDSTRSGCQAFGFLLDGPLASWPPGYYDDPTWRQRIPPALLTLQPLYAGAPADRVKGDVEQARSALEAALRPFGTRLVVAPVALAPAAGPTRILVSDDHDRPLGRLLAEAVPDAACCEAGPGTDTLTLVLGGDPARFACVAASGVPVDTALEGACAR